MLKSYNFPDKIYYASYNCTHVVGAYHAAQFSNPNKVKKTCKSIVLYDPSGGNKNYLVKDNLPIEKVKLINGSAVMLDEETSVNIDADFIADAALNNCISPNGEIIGPFVFCKYKSNYSLVRVGSPLYQYVEERCKRAKMPKIKSKNFEIGGIYITPGGKKSIYLGSVNTTKWNSVNYSKYLKNKKLFFQSYASEDLDFSNFTFGDTITLWNFDFKQSHSFVEMIDHINIPEDFIFMLRNSVRKYLKDRIVESSKNKLNKNTIEWEYRRLSPLVNAHRKGEKVDAFDISKYITLA